MLISVVIPTYNGEKYIKEQMDSILSQELSDLLDVELEIIVSDDLSKDKTIDLVKSYCDDRIKILMHNQKRTHKYNKEIFAVTENVGNALLFAKGDYVFLSDQDDIWHPKKIVTQIKKLQASGGGVCAHSLIYITEDKRFLRKKTCKCGSFLSMCKCMPLHGMSMCISRDVLDCILPFPNILQHDIYLALWAKWNKCLFLVNEPLVAHRILIGGKNISYSASKTPRFIKLYYRLKLIFCVLVSESR